MKRRETFVFRSTIPRPASEVFDWHFHRGSLLRALIPCNNIEILEEGPSKIAFRYPLGFLSKKWVFEQTARLPLKEFSMEEKAGLFSGMQYHCKIHSSGDKSCELVDQIRYAFLLPFFNGNIHRRLHHALAWKHEVQTKDLQTYASYPKRSLRILLSGSRGFLGRQMKAFLTAGGHQVISLVRSKGRVKEKEIYWDPSSGEIDGASLEDFDAVIHLAGESIVGRWTKKKKRAIFLSRCRDTWLLSEALARLEKPPRTVICASAIGFYGDRGEELLTETSRKGKGFLADTCLKWEEALSAIKHRGARVVHARFGVILSPSGGMLEKLLLPFRMKIGVQMGENQQKVSWIHLDDAIGSIYHLLWKEEVQGPVNIVAPYMVAQEEFSQTLAKCTRAMGVVKIPRFLLRIAFGEAADELMFMSAHVYPEKLLESGYHFRYPHLKESLKYL